MTYKLISVIPVERNTFEVTLEKIPGFLGRLFGVATKQLKFRGECTVWHEYPTGKRQGTEMESLICDLLKRYKFMTPT